MRRLLTLFTLAVVTATPAFAQSPPVVVPPPGVPGIPGAMPGAVNGQIQATAEDLARQTKLANQALSDATRSRDATLATSGSLSAGDPHVTKPIPAAPTAYDVHRAEQHLARLRSQVRVGEVADAGLVTATNSSRARARIVFPYLESSIYEIYTAPDRMTSIELQPGEHLTTENGRPKAADTVQWVADTVSAGEGAEKRTIILIKPILSGLETNMLIPTNKRVYHLLLRADTQAYMPLVGFSYPFEEAKAREAADLARAQEEASKERVAVPPESLRFKYSVQGSRVAWRPIRVFDDGQKTYIEMSKDVKTAEAPALFVMESDSPLIVNYRVKGDFYIVDRLFEHAQLRISRKAVDIYRDRS